MATATKYPVHYHDIRSRGFRWLKLAGTKVKEIILWQHEMTNELRITVRFKDGRLSEFGPMGNGTLTIAKPKEVTPEDEEDRLREIYREANSDGSIPF